MEIFLYLSFLIIQTSWTNLYSIIFIKLKLKIIHWLYKFSSFYKITPLSTLRKGGSKVGERKRVLCWSILIISLCWQDKPDVNDDESYFFRVTEAIFVGWFTLEYLIRFLVAPDKVTRNKHSVSNNANNRWLCIRVGWFIKAKVVAPDKETMKQVFNDLQ